MNIVSAFSQGSLVLNLVFLLLILMSCASWYVIGLKAFRLRNEYKIFHSFVNQHVKNKDPNQNSGKDWAARSDLSEFIALYLKGATQKNSFSSLNLLLQEALNCIKANKNKAQNASDAHLAEKNKKHHRVITMHFLQALDEIRFRLDHGLTILASIGSCAPFIGLFGTVWGIYHALKNISSQGSAGLATVSGPIGEALVATAIGLFAAIPAVLAYNSFVRLNRILVQNLRHLAEQIEIYL